MTPALCIDRCLPEWIIRGFDVNPRHQVQEQLPLPVLPRSSMVVASRPLVGAPPAPNRCAGTTLARRPCRISSNLDCFGYCQYHAMSSAQCQGTTQAGHRCRIAWQLNDAGFCQYHYVHLPRRLPRAETLPLDFAQLTVAAASDSESDDDEATA